MRFTTLTFVITMHSNAHSTMPSILNIRCTPRMPVWEHKTQTAINLQLTVYVYVAFCTPWILVCPPLKRHTVQPLVTKCKPVQKVAARLKAEISVVDLNHTKSRGLGFSGGLCQGGITVKEKWKFAVTWAILEPYLEINALYKRSYNILSPAALLFFTMRFPSTDIICTL